MLYPDETQVSELTSYMKNMIRDYAKHGGGIYRMNTTGANYYSFTFLEKDGKLDFVGGWDWEHTVNTHFEYVYDIDENKFMTTEEFIKERE